MAILQTFLLFSMIWYCRIQSPVMSKQQDIRRCGFYWFYSAINCLCWNSRIDRAISTTSCSYCIWYRYRQNHRSILPNFLLFAWFDTLEFNRLPCSNKMMYDDAVFADRFCYQLTMFGIRLLIGLSRLHHALIKYESDCAKMSASFCRISYCFAWFDTAEFNRLPCSKSKIVQWRGFRW